MANDVLCDCVISYGELDPERYGKYKNSKREIVKHNVTEQEAKDWYGSIERFKRVQELEKLGREKYGDDYWMKWKVSYFYTLAHKD